MRLRLRFDAHAPLLLGTGGGIQQVRTSGSVIPGAAVVGAIARHLLSEAGVFREDPFQADPPRNPELDRLLNDLEAGPLFPVPLAVAGPADGAGWLRLEAFRAPSTARTCKRFPGFCAPVPNESRAGDGVIDLLTDAIRGGHVHPKCPKGEPDHRADRFRSYVYRTDGGGYGEARLSHSARIRVGLNRSTETAEEGFLYQVEPVEPRDEGGYAFVGDGFIPDQLWPELAHRLGGVGQAVKLRVALGGGQSRGYGWGELTIAPAPPTRPLPARLEAFHRAVGRDKVLLVADLRSPWPLSDPARSPGDEVLASLQPPTSLKGRIQYKPEYSFLETELWGGWSMAWGLPKTRQLALAPGSVLVFEVTEDTDRDVLLAWMADREAVPSGPEAGTGWLTWFDPFHLDFAARADDEAAKEASA